MTTNKSVLAWIDEMKELVQPDKLVWIDGSEEQLAAICTAPLLTTWPV